MFCLIVMINQLSVLLEMNFQQAIYQLTTGSIHVFCIFDQNIFNHENKKNPNLKKVSTCHQLNVTDIGKVECYICKQCEYDYLHQIISEAFWYSIKIESLNSTESKYT